MTVRTNSITDPSPLDRKAHEAVTRISEKHGLLARARNVFHAMANELLQELQPAIEDQARTQADQTAKQRLRDILALPEAEGRRDLAERLALDSDTPVDGCAAILKSSPRQAAHDPLGAIMRGRSPGISSDDGSDVEAFAEDTEVERAANFILTAGGALK